MATKGGRDSSSDSTYSSNSESESISACESTSIHCRVRDNKTKTSIFINRCQSESQQTARIYINSCVSAQVGRLNPIQSQILHGEKILCNLGTSIKLFWSDCLLNYNFSNNNQDNYLIFQLFRTNIFKV